VEIGQVEAFLAVGTFGGFRRAADALRVTQPAISARIRALEQSLGVPLFLRSQTGLALSAAGRAFRPHAEQLLHAVALARQAVHDLRPASGSALQIAAALSICTYVLPDALARFSAGHPSVRLTVKTGTSEEILEMVLHDQVQLGIMRALGHAEVESTPLYADQLVLIAGPSHRLADRRQVRLADLAGEALILFGRSASFRDDTEAIFHQAGVVPGSIMELDNIEAAKKMVERGLGISLVPASVVAAELAAGALTELDLGDAAPARREIVAVRRRDAGPPSGAVAVFLTMLRELETAG